jgi:hypothetical protein
MLATSSPLEHMLSLNMMLTLNIMLRNVKSMLARQVGTFPLLKVGKEGKRQGGTSTSFQLYLALAPFTACILRCIREYIGVKFAKNAVFHTLQLSSVDFHRLRDLARDAKSKEQ